jgi:hypothetical protein
MTDHPSPNDTRAFGSTWNGKILGELEVYGEDFKSTQVPTDNSGAFAAFRRMVRGGWDGSIHRRSFRLGSGGTKRCATAS